MKNRYLIKHLMALIPALVFLLSPAGHAVENIDPGNDGHQYAWGENAGWFNFEPGSGPGVTVDDDALTGFAWGENIGWINLSPTDCTGCGVINDGNGYLSGFAWGENVGWINFDPAGGGVSIEADGTFTGFAWGENIGWINFELVSQPDSTVMTAWQPGATLITLSSFTAHPGSHSVTLRWETESETGNAGFNIHRSETRDGGYEQVTPRLLPAEGTPTEGAEYEFVDDDVVNRTTYYYMLEDVDLDGVSTLHGPVRATPRRIYDIIR
ncbi:hypothetical protein ACFL43_02595 [Thermodesulfobacteriota bacterium]